MVLTPKQQEEVLELSRPLMKWLAENLHPHCNAKVSCADVEISEDVYHSGLVLDYIK